MGRATYTGLESVTQGLARATSHRVLAPPAGTLPRYSIPFFQNIAQGVRLSEHVLEWASRLEIITFCVFLIRLVLRVFLVPPEVLRLKGQRGELGQTDCELITTTVAMRI